jgi:hypothetical protein
LFIRLQLAGNAARGDPIQLVFGVNVPMQSLKRDLFSALIMCLIAVVIAMAWGSPFIEATPAHAQKADRVQQLLKNTPVKVKPHPGTLSPSANR